MKKLLNEIREQPEHIREIFMWVMVVMTFSVVGFFTMRSTFGRLAVLINPDAADSENTTVIVKDKQNNSPLDLLGESASDIKANLSDLFKSSDDGNVEILNDAEPVPPVRLP